MYKLRDLVEAARAPEEAGAAALLSALSLEVWDEQRWAEGVPLEARLQIGESVEPKSARTSWARRLDMREDHLTSCLFLLNMKHG